MRLEHGWSWRNAYLEMFLETITTLDGTDWCSVYTGLLRLSFHLILRIDEVLVVFAFFAHGEMCWLKLFNFLLLYLDCFDFFQVIRVKLLNSD